MSDSLLDVTRLSDPVYVGQAMMRGQIAKLTPAHLHALHGKEVADITRSSMDDVLTTIGEAEARIARSRNIIFALVMLHLTVGLGITAMAWAYT